MPQRCLRLGAVTALMLAVQCKYQRIQGLFKWLAHGEGANYKAFLVSDIGLNIQAVYYGNAGSNGTSYISM